MKELCSHIHIKEPLTELINIVDNSGGKFACRGYITQEVLKCVWGNGSNGRVFATGCPSLYQNGLLHIEKSPDKENIWVAINGRVRDFKDAIIRQAFAEQHTVYVCQDEYCKVLYGENNVEIQELIKKYSYFGMKLSSEKR